MTDSSLRRGGPLAGRVALASRRRAPARDVRRVALSGLNLPILAGRASQPNASLAFPSSPAATNPHDSARQKPTIWAVRKGTPTFRIVTSVSKEDSGTPGPTDARARLLPGSVIQTLLTTCALASALVLSLSARQATHHRTAESERGEVEVRLGQLGGDLLDFGATLPVASDAPLSADGATLWTATSLEEWHGIDERVDLPADRATLPVQVRVGVETVRKQGDAFVPTTNASPFRRVQVELQSVMGATVRLERIYASR